MAIGFAVAVVNANSDIITSFNPEPSTVFFKEVTEDFIGDWQNRGKLFTSIPSTVVGKTFLGVLIVVPIIFLLHFLTIGPKDFSSGALEQSLTPFASIPLFTASWVRANFNVFSSDAINTRDRLP